MELNQHRTFAKAPGTTTDRPGIYTWEIEGVGCYVGKYTRAGRPLREYNRNVRRLLSGKPYRKSKPTKYRDVHWALAKALQEGWPITLTILENCSLDELRNRERHYIATVAWGGLNRTR